MDLQRLYNRVDDLAQDFSDHRVEDASHFGAVLVRLDSMDREIADLRTDVRDVPVRLADALRPDSPSEATLVRIESQRAAIAQRKAVAALAKRVGIVVGPLVALLGVLTALVRGWL